MCCRSTLEEVPVQKYQPFIISFFEMVCILWDNRPPLCKEFAIEKVLSFLFPAYQKGLFVYWVTHLWCLMGTMFSSVCKLFPPLSFKSTVLIEGQEGAQTEVNNRLFIYKYKHLFFLVWMLSFPLKLCRLPKISPFSKLLTFSLLLPDSVENTSCCYQFHILRASSDFEYRLCFWEGQK